MPTLFRISLVLLLAVLVLQSSARAAPQSAGSGASSTQQQEPAPAAPDKDVRDRAPVLTGTDLVRADFPGSWPMFGENTRMKVGGYAKADLLYDFSGTTDSYQFLMSTIPVKGSPEYEDDGYMSFFARETRFNIDVRSFEADRPPIRAFIEGDFWNDDNQFRLRHAYIVAGDFLVGQTWTTLSALESLPVMIDFAAGDALFGGRTSQIRYQTRLEGDDRWKLALAIEKLPYDGIENSSNLAGKPREALPVLAVRADREWDSGVLILGASIAQLRWDGGASGPDADAIQWAALLAGRQYLDERDFFTWNFSYSEGAGENIMAFAGSSANAVLTPNGDLDTMRSISALLGYKRQWTAEIESNFSYAYGWLDTPSTRAPDALKKGGIAHANLIWRPINHLSYGAELMYGSQRTEDDSLGHATRIQFMARFDF